MTKLLLVDDHVLVRQGIAKLLAETAGIEVVGEAGNGTDAIARARALKPDLILMDLYLPDMTGIEATRTIKQEMPEMPVLLLTVSDGEDHVYEAVTSGAQGYVVKTTDHGELIRQIRQAASGEVAISPAVVSKLASSLSRRAASKVGDGEFPEQLTTREKEVLKWISQGARNKEIASVLSISINTVRAHVRSIMHKLEAENRAQLAAYAVRHNLV